MPLFRMAAAAGLLFALAPEPTTEAVRGMFGFAANARADALPTAEAAIAYCRIHPKICMDAARRAGEGAALLKP